MTDYIKINNEEHPFTFNYSAIKYLLQNTDKTNIVDLLSAMDIYDVVLWVCLKQGYFIEKRPFKLTVEDVEGFLNDDFLLLNRVAEAMQTSILGNKADLPADEKKVKKKKRDLSKQTI